MVDVEDVKHLPNYLFPASKAIKHEGKHYRVQVTIQMFVDENGQVKLVREV